VPKSGSCPQLFGRREIAKVRAESDYDHDHFLEGLLNLTVHGAEVGQLSATVRPERATQKGSGVINEEDRGFNRDFNFSVVFSAVFSVVISVVISVVLSVAFSVAFSV
jgi:hypothetical protein